MINFNSRLQKIQFKLKTAACPVNPGLCKILNLSVLFQLIWLQTLFAINSESCQRKIQSFYKTFDVSRRGHRFISAALHSANARDSNQNILIGSFAQFLLKDQWIIERSSKAMNAALVSNKFWRPTSKFLCLTQSDWQTVTIIKMQNS